MTTIAYAAGQTDGETARREWDDDRETAAEYAAKSRRGGVVLPDEGLINAVEPSALYRLLGLPESTAWGGAEWKAALDQYNDGYLTALAE